MQVWSFHGGAWHDGEEGEADFRWFDVTGGEAGGLPALAERFRLHHLAVEDCLSPLPHAPKIDDFGDYLFVVLHAVVESNDGRETEELDVFLGKVFLITHQDKPIVLSGPGGGQPAASALMAALQGGVGVRPGSDGLLYELLDRIVDAILPRVNILAEELDAIHDDILVRAHAREQHRDILALRARAG
ncbi:MAG: CorA family divalent cation transporter, partial [Tepidiformaceae bacterium]